MEQRALDLLRRMSDRLAGASSFSVWARCYREIPATTGQMLTFANTTEVTVRRPDRMRAEVTGDLNFRFWYDGASIAVLDAGKRFYARADAPPRLDEMLSFAVDRYGVHFPLSDFLVSDPYAVLSTPTTTRRPASWSNSRVGTSASRCRTARSGSKRRPGPSGSSSCPVSDGVQ
jgi:hypothetical protein